MDAAQLLGQQVRLGRRERRWTVEELAERVGTSHVTIRKVERGDLSVGLGVAFEAATIVGVALFHEDAGRRSLEVRHVSDRLAVLPERSRRAVKIDNDF